MDYMGPLNFMIYHSEELFQQDEFGTESVKKVSTFKNQQVDEKKPNWINLMLQKNTLSDETQPIKLGIANEMDFH